MRHFFVLHLFVIFICTGYQTYAQKQKTAVETCEMYMNDGFISDGQYYTYAIQKDEVKQTKITLMGGNTYRVAACGSVSKKIQFSIVDVQGNVLYTNTNFDYAPYWDFEINKTIECTILLQNNDTTIPTDKSILLIGYKR